MLYPIALSSHLLQIIASFDVFPPHQWNVPGVVDFGYEDYVETWPPSIQSELRQFLGAAASLVKTRIKLPPYST